jgi:hypothetical protein
MQPVFRNAAVEFGFLADQVGVDVVPPAPEQHVGV